MTVLLGTDDMLTRIHDVFNGVSRRYVGVTVWSQAAEIDRTAQRCAPSGIRARFEATQCARCARYDGSMGLFCVKQSAGPATFR